MKLDSGITLSPRLTPEAGPHSLFTLIDVAASQPEALVDMWQHVVDGLTEQIALLDEEWTILVVNRSWAKVAELYGHFALVPGTNYLQFCRMKVEEGLDIAKTVVAGIEQIDAGTCDSFDVVYRASQPEVGHAHRLYVTRFEVAGRKFASITRYDVTRLVELRKLREDFSHSVILGQAEERQRLGRELHDSTMQLMVCLSMKIGQLRRASGVDGTDSLLDEMEQLLAETQQEIRSISYLAHPPLLGELTLPDALRALVEGFGRRTGLDVEFEIVGELPACSPAIEGATYRIVQEALSNVHRHSKAKHAQVRLSRHGDIMHAVIADDGIGMPSVVTSGVGLAGMRSRLAELGGRLSIRSRAPGTAVIASVPANKKAFSIVR